MKRHVPFAAALALAASLRDIAALRHVDVAEFNRRLAGLVPLRHRGKGRGTGINRDHVIHAYKMSDGAIRQVAWPVQRSRYSPHQGERECERRRVGGSA